MEKLFDAHFHIIDPAFPLKANQGFMPEPFLTKDYLDATHHYQLQGGAIVSGSFQGFDQGYLLNALSQLGPAYAGVTQLPLDASDKQILSLNQAGVRAIRFNLKRGCVEDLHRIDHFARRLFELCQWHSEFYVDSKSLPAVASVIASLPAAVVDHLGLEKDNQRLIKDLCEKGVAIKATGFGRLDFEPIDFVKQLYCINPESLIFGTDLPSTRARTPYSHNNYLMLKEAVGPEALGQIMWKNAVRLYRTPV